MAEEYTQNDKGGKEVRCTAGDYLKQSQEKWVNKNSEGSSETET